VRHQDLVDELAVQVVDARRQIDHAELDLHIEEHRDIAELQMAVDQHCRRVLGIQPDGQVGGQGGTPHAPFGRIHCNQPALRGN